MKKLALILILASSSMAFARDEVAEVSTTTSDEAITETLDQPWRLSAFLQPITGEVGATPASGMSIRYQTEGVMYYGLGVRYRDFGIEVALPLKSSKVEGEKEKVETNHFVTELSQNFEKSRYRASYARYQGFALNEIGGVEVEKSGIDYQDSNLRLEEVLVTGIWSLDNEGLDYRSFEDLRGLPNQLVYSLGLMGYVQHSDLKTRAGLFPTKLGYAYDVSQIEGATLSSIGTGFSFHSFRRRNYHVFSFALDVGGGPQRQMLSNFAESWTRVAPAGRGTLGFGYAYLVPNGTWTLAFDFSYDATYTKADTDEIRTGLMKGVLGARTWL